MRLSEAALGKNNNFNLIRFLAAFAVLVSHSFLISTGIWNSEPLRSSYGLTWGDIAVNVFFVTSGFLVTASLLSRRNAIAFVQARALRIYPALLVMLILVVFVMGSALTAESLREYLGARQTWHYFVKNALLVAGINYELPGLFVSNPFKLSVNDSLWTLVYEVHMYVALLVIWLVCRGSRAFTMVVVGCAIVSGAIYLWGGHFEPASQYSRLGFMFFTGAGFYVLRSRIVLYRAAFAALAGAVAISLLQRETFFFVLSFSLAYLLMYSAYAFGGAIRAFNRVGDYSYGIYIYAYPVQQSLTSVFKGISTLDLMMFSATVTLGLAALSWHLIERRALSLKGRTPQEVALQPLCKAM